MDNGWFVLVLSSQTTVTWVNWYSTQSIIPKMEKGGGEKEEKSPHKLSTNSLNLIIILHGLDAIVWTQYLVALSSQQQGDEAKVS